MIHCRNSSCEHYFEDVCMINYEKTVVVDENGKCETFEKGEHEGYKRPCETCELDQCVGCEFD